MYTEICQLIRAAKEGDTEKAMAYANLLACNLAKAGLHTESNRVWRAIYDTPIDPAKAAVLDGLPQPAGPCVKAMFTGPGTGTLEIPSPYSGGFTGSTCGDLQQHDY